MSDRPHMMLPWIFDIPNQTVTCKISDDLNYVALQGGVLGYTKMYKGEISHVESDQWHLEKMWISDNYGDIVGYYQPDDTRMVLAGDMHDPNRMIPAHGGLDENGRYLDHMQRSQDLMEGFDMAIVGHTTSGTQYQTPDNGLTIYKRIQTSDTLYGEKGLISPTGTFLEHSQPCMMQPRTPGVRISSHDEMLAEGISPAIVNSCKAGKWDSPKRPDLQKHYIYPTK